MGLADDIRARLDDWSQYSRPDLAQAIIERTAGATPEPEYGAEEALAILADFTRALRGGLLDLAAEVEKLQQDD